MVELVGITQTYGSHMFSLEGINISARPGEILAVIGHNGSGKSTLLKILTGMAVPSRGKILIDGEEVVFQSVFQAKEKGLELLQQTPATFPDLSIVDNLFAGNECTRGYLGLRFLDRKKMEREAKEILRGMDLNFGNLRRPVTALSGGQIAIIGFLRALQRKPRLLALDEPAAALGPKERDEVNKVIRKVALQGVAVVLVTHLLKDAMNLADKVAILNDGHLVFCDNIAGLSENDLLIYMD